MQDVLLMSESFCCFFVVFLVLKTLKELNRAKDQIFFEHKCALPVEFRKRKPKKRKDSKMLCYN